MAGTLVIIGTLVAVAGGILSPTQSKGKVIVAGLVILAIGVIVGINY